MRDFTWIEVKVKDSFDDPLGRGVKEDINKFFSEEVTGVTAIKVYVISRDFSKEQLQTIGPALHDPIIEECKINSHLASNVDFSWLVEVGFRPGVKDNLGNTAKIAIEDALDIKFSGSEGVYSFTQFLLKGDISEKEVEGIANGLLGNRLINSFNITPSKKLDGLKRTIPEIKLRLKQIVERINLQLDDEAMMRLSQERLLALSIEELKAIRGHFKKPSQMRNSLGLGEDPTDVELECIAQTWSEHCKHKIFNAEITHKEPGKTEIVDGCFKSFIKNPTKEIGKKIDWLVSVFDDNAGIIKFNDKFNLVFKVETHNSPSALDPYGGALTGIVGVNRDPLGAGTGSRLIANTDVFCFAPPNFSGDVPKMLLHPRRVFEGVRRGVEHGGNKSGIPTVNGCIVFDERYLGKPLVFCGTLGIAPSKINGKPTHIKTISPEDLVVIAGGRTGLDGVHGATFSSEKLNERSPTSAVQIGDPFTQKKLADFLLEARNSELYTALTDNGAGGISSSVGEISRLCGGCKIQLKDVPLKYEGLQPWEILVSESQERMTLAVPKEKIAKLKELAALHDVGVAVIGEFTKTGNFHILFGQDTVALLDLDFLHNGCPKLRLEAEWNPTSSESAAFSFMKDFGSTLKSLLSSPNICSKEQVVRQYDHEVQGGSIIKPLCGNDGPSDAAVLLPLESMENHSFQGVGISNGICPKFSEFDTYHMAANAMDEAIRNLVAVGGDISKIALVDNFCWPDPVFHPESNPDGKHKLAQLVRANKAIKDYALAFGTPFISGKDSMKNDFHAGNVKISVPPTLLISAIGNIEDVKKCITMDFKNRGDVIYLLGITRNELGGSELFMHLKINGGDVPTVDACLAKNLYIAVGSAIKEGVLNSCHDCSDGGLAVAVAESSFAGGLGAEVDLSLVQSSGHLDDCTILFSETPSRFVVSVAPESQSRFEELLASCAFSKIGIVKPGKSLVIKGQKGNFIIDEGIEGLKSAWQGGLK